MSFESNRGQADSPVRFLSRSTGYSILFKDREAVLLLEKRTSAHQAPRQPGKPELQHQSQAETSTDTLHMKLAGSLTNPVLTGEVRLPGTVSYFTGSDPSQWHAGIPTFERVRYAGVYPGVNLVYYGNRQRLEFDFEVAPGADANLIRMQFDGARKVKLDQDGNLVIVAANGSISFHKPVVYQPAVDGRQAVDGRFRIVAGKTVGFTVGPYDHSKPLVIDPILNYSTYFGSIGDAYGIAVDSAGNTYIAGWTAGGLPTTGGAFQTAPATKTGDGGVGTSAFVAKLNSTGTAILYSTYLSGDHNDQANAIAIDSSGNAYVAGQTTSTTFPVTSGAFQTTMNASYDNAFLAKLNSTGTQLLYSTYLGGSDRTQAAAIAVDVSGNAYVAGQTLDADFPTTKGSLQPTPKSNPLANVTGFVTEVNPTGKSLVYSTYLSGSGTDVPTAIALDSGNNAYIGGYTTSTDFPTTAGAYQRKGGGIGLGTASGFISKLNSAGDQLVYSTYLGGEDANWILALALDASDNAYVTGLTSSPDFPVTAGVFQPLPLGLGDGGQGSFITKLNSSGSALEYSSFLSTGQDDTGVAIAVDSAGNANIAGYTYASNFPVTPGALQTVNRETPVTGDGTGFLTKINPTASQILYSTYLGGSGEVDSQGFEMDSPFAVAVDNSGNVYVAGKTVSEDFPTTAGAYQLQNLDTSQSDETFVTEFNASEMTTPPITTTKVASSNNPQVYLQPVTFTATVKPTSSSTPTGTVAFSVTDGIEPTDLTSWTAVTLDGSGQATYTVTPVQGGPTVVNVYYLGDANNAPSSGTMTQAVSQISTVTTITSNENSVPYGTPVVFTATVVDSSGNPFPGIVGFEFGSVDYADVVLNAAGQATWTNGTGGPFLPEGSDVVTAVNFSDLVDGYAGSSASITETFIPLGGTPAPTFDPAAGTYTYEQYVTLNDASSTSTIYYTTDGTTPVIGTAMQAVPGESIQVNTTQTIQAFAVAPGYTASSIVSAAYVINIPPPTFTVSGTAVTVAPGATTGNTSTITVTPSGNFLGSVALTAVIASSPAGAVYFPTLSFGTSSPVNIVGASAESATLTITTTAPTSALLAEPDKRSIPWFAAGSTALACILLFAFPARLRRWRSMLAMMVLLATLVSGVLSCGGAGSGGGGGGGGGGTPGTTAGAYTITVTGTSGTTTATGTINLTVQ